MGEGLPTLAEIQRVEKCATYSFALRGIDKKINELSNQ